LSDNESEISRDVPLVMVVVRHVEKNFVLHHVHSVLDVVAVVGVGVAVVVDADYPLFVHSVVIVV
jgi:hypothetical protein